MNMSHAGARPVPGPGPRCPRRSPAGRAGRSGGRSAAHRRRRRRSQAAACRSLSAPGRSSTGHSSRCSIAPADALTADGLSGAWRWVGNRTPWTPARFGTAQQRARRCADPPASRGRGRTAARRAPRRARARRPGVANRRGSTTRAMPWWPSNPASAVSDPPSTSTIGIRRFVAWRTSFSRAARRCGTTSSRSAGRRATKASSTGRRPATSSSSGPRSSGGGRPTGGPPTAIDRRRHGRARTPEPRPRRGPGRTEPGRGPSGPSGRSKGSDCRSLVGRGPRPPIVRSGRPPRSARGRRGRPGSRSGDRDAARRGPWSRPRPRPLAAGGPRSPGGPRTRSVAAAVVRPSAVRTGARAERPVRGASRRGAGRRTATAGGPPRPEPRSGTWPVAPRPIGRGPSGAARRTAGPLPVARTIGPPGPPGPRSAATARSAGSTRSPPPGRPRGGRGRRSSGGRSAMGHLHRRRQRWPSRVSSTDDAPASELVAQPVGGRPVACRRGPPLVHRAGAACPASSCRRPEPAARRGPRRGRAARPAHVRHRRSTGGRASIRRLRSRTRSNSGGQRRRRC